MHHACDLCGADKPHALPQDPRIGVCGSCGFVYVPERRSPAEVAAAWAEVYASGGYDPQWPGVKARLYYVAEWIEQHLEPDGTLLDIGAGDGEFIRRLALEGITRRAKVAAIEPASDAPEMIVGVDRRNWHRCSIEDAPADLGKFDLVTINWTLENTADALGMLRFARQHVKDDGHVVVATGSRILVPFKKPLSHYLAKDRPADLHCFRWSANSLIRAMARAGLSFADCNDYEDRDEMIVAAKPGAAIPQEYVTDSPDEVRGFFAEWERLWP